MTQIMCQFVFEHPWGLWVDMWRWWRSPGILKPLEDANLEWTKSWHFVFCKTNSKLEMRESNMTRCWQTHPFGIHRLSYIPKNIGYFWGGWCRDEWVATNQCIFDAAILEVFPLRNRPVFYRWWLFPKILGHFYLTKLPGNWSNLIN